MVRAKVLWCSACVAAVVTASTLWTLKWIARGPLECIRWRFTAYDGRSFRGEIWHALGNSCQAEAWAGKISGLSGQLEVSIPLRPDLPWYKKPFQPFRVLRRIPYQNGRIHGSVIHFSTDGRETAIEQYQHGQEHGIHSYFKEDSSFSHLLSYRNGMLDGPCISRWTNGVVSNIDMFSMGKKTGLSLDWWPTGELKREGVFDKYKPIGRHSFWFHSNRAKSHEIQYSADGIPTQTTVWSADGRCIGTGTYKDGHEWDGYFAVQTKGDVFLGRFSAGQRVEYEPKWLKDNVK